MAVPVCVL